MNWLHSIIVFFLVCAPSARCAGPRFIFTFGDSYSGTSFNIDGTKPSQSNPLGNPGYGRNTSCANSPGYYCPNWVEILTVNYSTTNTLSYNFAQGGAVINNGDSKQPGAPSNMTSQLVIWTGKIAPKPSYAPWSGDNSVVIAWYGVNDLTSISSSSTWKTDINNDLNDLFINFKWMYNYGMRRFVIFNAPPFNRAPVFAGSSNCGNIAGNITAWNNVLPTMTNDFVKNSAGSTVKILDTQAIFNKILNDPNKYPSPWGDPLHPGADIHKSLAASAYSLLQSISFYK